MDEKMTGAEIYLAPETNEMIKEKVLPLGEITELQEENCKVFAMSDGTLQAVFYPDTVQDAAAQAEQAVSPMRSAATISRPATLTAYSWNEGTMFSDTLHTVGMLEGSDGVCRARRMYVKLAIPTLPRNPRIKKAELKFTQMSGYCGCAEPPKIGLYQVTGDITVGTCTPTIASELIDFERIRSVDDRTVVYTFDITSLIDQINRGESVNKGLLLKLINENDNCNSRATFAGTTDNTYAPTLCITYESNYGINTGYKTHTHDLGRFGQGSVDLQCGNLMFDAEEFSWGGNRMPVTIKHLYNSVLSDKQYTVDRSIGLYTADFSAMNLGYGWKLNLMQSMVSVNFWHEGVKCRGYVYTDENGIETYFKEGTKQCCDNAENCCYFYYEDIDGSEMLYDPYKWTLKKDQETYFFDAHGRLVGIEDVHKNRMDIHYTEDRITSVTDGAGRVFTFTYYEDGFLDSITAPDGTAIAYSYRDSYLTAIYYPDGREAFINYQGSKPSELGIIDENINPFYKVGYTFTGDRLSKVTEFGAANGVFVPGVSTSYDYSVAAKRTVVETREPLDRELGETADTVVKTVYTFDNEGNTVSEYMYTEETGNIGVEKEAGGINPHGGDSTGVISNINNLLLGHNFESFQGWATEPGSHESFHILTTANERYSKFGRRTFQMQSYQGETMANGVYQDSIALSPGDYTFSAYLRIGTEDADNENIGAYIRVTKADGTVLAESEHLSKYDTEFMRLIIPFALETEESVRVHILLDGKGTIYVDGAQLENNPYANPYNMLVNGNFEHETTGWEKSNYVNTTSSTHFNMKHSLKMKGNIDEVRTASQNVAVKSNRGTRETFTLSGWAKGNGVVNREREGCEDAQFRLRAEIQYYDSVYQEYGTETYTADFSSCTEDWQLASVQFTKEKYRKVRHIRVFCDYSYNTGNAYFDDIQLIRNSIETGLSASDFSVESTGGADDEEESEALEVQEDTAPGFEEYTDDYGNALTETTFTDGEFGTVYRAFGFSHTGNDLCSETDAKGNKTEYTVDEATSRNDEITDRCGNKTAYEYDNSGRTTKVISKEKDGTVLADVSYTYDGFDNLTEIARGDGMKYALAYNEFHNLANIKVAGMDKPLVSYTYKNGNGRLKAITYANGHVMKATYNSIGQMIEEKWYASSDATVPMAHYKYGYDGQGNIVRSVDILQKREYTYTYEEGKIVRAAEHTIEVNAGGLITSRTFENSIIYVYDSEGKLIKKKETPKEGIPQTTYYEHPENGNTVVKFRAGVQAVTSHSKTDSFGRKVFDELQLDLGFVSRQFSYHKGEATDTHVEQGKLKSSPTTQLVSRIEFSDGRLMSYEYDEEERITKVTDSLNGVDKVTVYTYDALGQLTSETVDGIKTGFEYDNYGNITAKGLCGADGVIAEDTKLVYTYGDTVWKDRLTGFNGQAITYDEQGNPLTYLGHTLTWEKGRQLKSFDSHTYTYNANGIRTSKTVNGVKHNYTLEGSKILRETWGYNELVTLFDNEENVCGLVYNDEPYYFMKNLQGDVIAITDRGGLVVARYSYDAWGVCTVEQDSAYCIGGINPYRYRGYYYDSEIGMYYLQSRYYDPVVGRFVNADEAELLKVSANNDSILGDNLFSYCLNNPACHIDETGMWLARLISGVVGAAIFGTLAYVVCKIVGMFVYVSKSVTAAITIAFAALGGIIGAVLGPGFIAKHSPKLLQALQKIEKTKFSLKAIGPNTGGNIFGIVISNTLIIMLHAPHPKYNEWYFHLQVEVKLGRKQIQIWKKPIVNVNPKTWRR